jgi:ADP-ribose pyrophosphatase YjhB (NUDIX family)
MNKPYSVSVRITEPKGNILWVRRSPSAPKRAGQYEYPGGHVEPGERAREAALREVREEVGLKIPEYELRVLKRVPQDKGDHIIFEYRARKAFRPRLSFEHDHFIWSPEKPSLQNGIFSYFKGKDTSGMSVREYAAAGRKAQKRVGLLSKLFKVGGSKAAGKVAGKAAAKAGAKVAAKGAAKFVPGVGEVMMVIDAAPEAIRVEKEKMATARESMRRVKEARGVKDTTVELGRGIGKYASQSVTGTARVAAAALVGSDVVHSTLESAKKNPASIRANVSEINSLLRKMPSDWRAQLDSSRMKLKAAGASSDELPPSSPDAHSVLLALNLNNRGEVSSEAAAGQEPTSGNAVPEDVREAAMEGIRLSHKNNYGGYDFIGVARAIQLAISPKISDAARNRMRMYFNRKTKQDRLSDQYANKHGKRYWSWLNWGGDPGARWTHSKRFAELVKENPMARKHKKNPFIVTRGGQAVPQARDEHYATWAAAATHADRQEGEGTKYRITGPDEAGHWHIVDARTGRSTGKYGLSKIGAQEVLKKLVRRTNPSPGITMEEWFADVADFDWANWDLDRAGIMHYSGRGIPTYQSIVRK